MLGLGLSSPDLIVMKFRGRITDAVSIRKFYSILGTMAKLSKVCVLRLNKDKLFFILTENSAAAGNSAAAAVAGPTVWYGVTRFSC